MKYCTAILFILLSITTYSQATMMVVLSDLEKAGPLAEANISLEREGKLVSKAITNEQGIAYIKSIPYGEYTITASKEGYAPKVATANVISPKTHTVELSLVRGGHMDEEESVVAFAKYKVRDMMSSISETTSAPAISAVTSYSAADTDYTPASGQVTASEWNDLHNWKSWLHLVEDGDYQIMTKRWAMSPTKRHSVLVLNDQNVPIANAKVSLIGPDKEVIWQSYSDNVGKAELWSEVFDSGQQSFEIRVDHGGAKETVGVKDSRTNGVQKVVLEKVCSDISAVDIVFTVDATGSMGDEISYLKAELLDVINRVKREAAELDLRTGAVFYRDEADLYLTRESALTSDVDTTLTFIMKQNADGGGDYPEAVHTAMEKTLALDWRTDALKLNFLILDAPPREDPKTLASIQEQIKKAASKGIRLIPITASGINRETEFLMKFMAILTNGTYIFITDDSGIGNPHLDPVVKDAEVEKLNDLMVRVITEFAAMQDCAAAFVDVKATELSIYPNPCTNFVNITTDYLPVKITLSANSGMIVKTVVPSEKSTRLELEDLVSGVYNVSIYSASGVETRPILVVR